MATAWSPEFRPTALPGCFEVRPGVHADARGRFVKTFQSGVFERQGLPAAFPETFYSESRAGVVRGLHFQLPPFAQGKLVYCVAGRAFDVLVDLRVGSPTYGRAASFDLDAENPAMLFVAEGFAHGFCAMAERTVLVYHATRVHVPSHDAGIRWDSAPVEWPVREPVLSERDRLFPTLAEFSSPFRFEGPG